MPAPRHRLSPLLVASLLLLVPWGCGGKSGGVAATAGTGGGTATAGGTAGGPAGMTSTSTGTSTGVGTATEGSTGCELPGATGWEPGATGTAGWVDYDGPYHPCETDADCADGNDREQCAPARCYHFEGVGSVCVPRWESCFMDPAGAHITCPDVAPLDCSDEAKSDPMFTKCAIIILGDESEKCDDPRGLQSVCVIDCNPPAFPCPEGMICHTPDPQDTYGYCLWPE